MSTQEIANRLVELCRKGDYETCYKELFSPAAVSIEAGNSFGAARTEGLEAIVQKGQQFNQMVEAVHDSSVGDPVVASNHFACTMMVDWTIKGQGRQKMDEVCVYKVEDGKIVSEQFFY